MKHLTYAGFTSNAAALAADLLVADRAPEHTAETLYDFSSHAVLLPGRNAVRKLSSALAGHGRGVFPPPIFLTPGTLLGFGRTDGARRIASGPESAALWLQTVAAADRTCFPDLFPEFFDPNDPAAVRNLARQMHALRTELVRSGFSIASAGKLLTEKNGGLTIGNDRRAQLAELERSFLRAMTDAGLSDPLDELLEAAADPEPFGRLARLTLIGTPDLPPIVRARLKTVDESGVCPIEIIVFAPAEMHAQFDEWGVLKPEAWSGRRIDFGTAPGRIHLVREPADAASLAVLLAPDPDRVFRPAETAVAMSDSGLFPFLRDSFAGLRDRDGRALDVYDPAGETLRSLRIVPLLGLVRRLADAASSDTVRALLRNGDFLRYLASDTKLDGDSILALSDQYFLLHLNDALLAGSPEPDVDLARVFARIARIRFELNAPARTAAEKIRDLLTAVFFADVYPPYRGVAFERETEAVRAALEQFESSPVLSALSAGPFLDLLIDELAGQRVYGEHEENAMEISGYLDLPFSSARRLILCGMNEGMTPEVLPGNAFLNDAKRRTLGLPDNASRYARDAFYLESMLAVRRGQHDSIHFIVLKISPDGSPLRASSLFFTGDGENFLDKAGLLFAPPEVFEPASAAVPGNAVFRLHCDFSRFLLGADGRTRIRVTAFKALLASPAAAYLSLTMGLDPIDYGVIEMNPPAVGLACHAALQNLSGADAENESLLRSALHREFDAFLRTQYGSELPLLIGVQHDMILQRLDAAAGPLAEAAEQGWRVLETEWPLGGKAGVELAYGSSPDGKTSKTAVLAGRIDRIEYRAASNELRLIDFKTGDRGTGPAEAHLARSGFADLQLPLYAALLPLDRIFAEKHPEIDFRTAVIHCGYFVLPKNVGDTGYRWWDDDSFGAALGPALECAREILCRIEKIRDGGDLEERPDQAARAIAGNPLGGLILPDPETALENCPWQKKEDRK